MCFSPYEADRIAVAALGKKTCEDDPLAYWALMDVLLRGTDPDGKNSKLREKARVARERDG